MRKFCLFWILFGGFAALTTATHNITDLTIDGCYGGMLRINQCQIYGLKIRIKSEIYGRHPEEKCFPSPSGTDCSVEGNFFKTLCNQQPACEYFGVEWKYINRPGCLDLYTNYVHIIYDCYVDRVWRVPLDGACDVGGDLCEDEHATCQWGFCKCRTDFYENFGICESKGLLNTPCLPNGNCTQPHTVCDTTTYRCRCDDEYFLDKQTCVSKSDLQQPCDSRMQPAGIQNVCRDPNAICESNLCVCRNNYYQLLNQCKLRGTLNSPCLVDQPQCTDAHTNCRQSFCQCQEGYFVKNGLTCEPRVPLNDPCNFGDTCNDLNANCTGGQCICSLFFYESSGVCKPKGHVNTPCLPNGNCIDKNSVCSPEKLCQCNSTFFYKVNQCVAKLPLDFRCTQDDLCLDVNAVCQTGYCRCRQGYQKDGDVCSSAGKLNSPCLRQTNSCLDANTVCINGFCSCNTGYFIKDGICKMKIVIGGPCVAGEQCSDTNAQCRNGFCLCQDGYYSDRNVCRVRGDLDSPCNLGGTCHDTNAVCLIGTCTCSTDYFNRNGTCVRKKDLNSACASGDICLDSNALCSQGLCKCSDKFYQSSDGVCRARGYLNRPCLQDSNSCYDPNANCTSNVCLCQLDFYEKLGLCRPKVRFGDPCDGGDVCAELNTECQDGQCKCRTGFGLDGTIRCAALGILEKSCLPDYTCRDDRLACVGFICRCRDAYFERNGTCVNLIPLNGDCGPVDQCQDSNAECRGSKCQCQLNYFAFNGACKFKVPLTDVCTNVDVCQDASSACTNGHCVCMAGFQQFDRICVSTSRNGSLGAFCLPGNACSDPRAICIGNVCACNIGYANINGTCVSQSSDLFCADSSTCGADPNQACIGGVCKCQPHYVKENSGLCVFNLPCSTISECSTPGVGGGHWVCSNGLCSCESNFQLLAGQCYESWRVGRLRCIGNGSASICGWNATCSGGYCVCASGYFAASDNTCHATLGLGAFCLAGDVCSDFNSVCLGGVCSCKDNFKMDSGVCAAAGRTLFGINYVWAIILLILAALIALLLLSLLLCCCCYCIRRWRKARDNYDKKLMEAESISTVADMNTLNLQQQHHQQEEHHLNFGTAQNGSSNLEARQFDSRSRRIQQQQQQHRNLQHHRDATDHRSISLERGTEVFTMDDLPRVTRLNKEEVRSIDSALLSAEEQDLIDTDTDTRSSYRHTTHRCPECLQSTHGRYTAGESGHRVVIACPRCQELQHQFSSGSRQQRAYQSETSISGRRLASERRLMSVPSVARTISHTQGQGVTPTTIHRNVSAFGEITVMPVGDEDENLRIAVEEQIIG